jgi:membrane protease YdiL (CAAX protease family)
VRASWTWQTDPTLRFLAFFPLALGASGLLLEVIAHITGYTGSPRPVWLLAVGTGLLDLAGFLMIHLLLRAHGVGWRAAFGLFSTGWPRRWLLTVFLTIPALGVAWLVHQFCGWILDQWAIEHDAQAAVEAIRQSGWGGELVLMFFFAVVTAPVVEEMLFRGVLWPLARDRGWRTTGLIGVSLLFAFIHLNAAALVPLCLLGMFWIWLYERTGDLTAPILSHAVFNGTNFVWLVFAERAG